jgi:hypothetical protein
VLRHQVSVLRRQVGRPGQTAPCSARWPITVQGPSPTAVPHPRHAPALALRLDHTTRDHQAPAIRAPTHVTTATQGDSTPRQRESWLGDRRIAGELTGMGRQIDASTVWAILKRTGIDPVLADNIIRPGLGRCAGKLACGVPKVRQMSCPGHSCQMLTSHEDQNNTLKPDRRRRDGVQSERPRPVRARVPSRDHQQRHPASPPAGAESSPESPGEAPPPPSCQ